MAAAAQLHGLWVALALVWLVRWRPEGDSQVLVRGARHALTCLGDATLTGCGEQVSHFPLVQYMLAVPAVGLGLSDEGVLRWLAIVNGIALVVAAAVLVRAGRRAGWLGAWLMVATALASPLVVYGASTFREPLSAAIVVLLVAAVLAGAGRGSVFVLAALASINQETLPPFVLALGLLAAWEPGSSRLRPWLARARPLIAGVALGVVLNAGFNLFRFGSPSNEVLLAEEFRVPTASWRAELAVSLWVSPNGGLLWFWFVPVVILVTVVSLAAAALFLHPRQPRRWAPGLALGAVAVAQTVGLASWWSPWGWYAWGPRLSYPLTAALALVAVHLERDRIRALGDRLRFRPGVVLFGIALVALSALPHLAAAYDDGPYRRQFFGSGDERCPVWAGNHTNGRTTVDYFFECQLLHRAWGRRPLVLVERGTAAFTPEVFPLVVLAVSTLAAGTSLERSRTGRRGPVAAPRPAWPSPVR